MIYSARVLDQNRTLLGILDCTKWGYSRKISEATEVSISIPRKQSSTIKNCDELFAFMNPVSPTETNDSWDTSTDPTQELAYFIEIYKDKQRLITALIAKRDFTDTSIELKCYTEETLLTKYLTPAQYGRKYESWDIADIARDMAKGWSVQRVKAKSQWDAGTLVNVDTSTEPGKVLLSKSSGTYNASGSVTLTFSRPPNWANWERIRWVGDFDGAVAVKMQYSTDGGSTWSSEYVGGEPDTLGIEIATTSATTVMVRLNLSTSDTTSQDSEGNAVGVTPRLFAVEVIARTTAYLTVSAESSTGLLCNGLELDKATPLEVLTAACQQVGKEFWVDDNTLYLGTMGSDKSNDIFLRKGTNMRITQLGDELAEVYNVIHAMGSGSGINRLEYTESDTNSIATYGVREKTEEFDTEDYDELVSLAQAYLAEHKDPIYSWKVKAQYPIDDEPTYGCGDTITVTDGVIVTTSRIEQMDRSYDNGISVMLYLNKTRADLIQRVKPTYSNLTTFERPIALSVYPTIKGLIASVSRPVDLSRWDYTELHLSTTADFTPSFETLNSEKKATMFEVNDLSPGTRYYVKVRHIANDGTASEFSDERSAVALAVTATDIDVRAGWDLAENSPSTGQVLIYGKDIDGNATTENGFITSGSGVLTVNYQAVTPIDDKTNFLRLSAGVVIPIYYDVNENKFYDASNTEVTTGVIIGTVTKASGSITSSQAYARAITIEQGKADQVSTAMRYLAQATDSESFDAIAKGLGIENAFYTLAVYNGFINNLYVNNLRITEGSVPQMPNALSFDGVNDYVDIGGSLNDTEFSISFHVKPASTQVEYACIMDNNHTSARSWVIQQNGTTVNQYGFFGIMFNLTADTDSHVVVISKSTGEKYVYVNNVLIGSTSASITYDGTEHLLLGAWGAGGRHFNGSIKDVRYFGKELSSSEVTTLYGGGSVTDSLEHVWGLAEGTGLTAYDSAGSNDGTIYGATWVIDQATGFDFHALTDDGQGNARFGAYYNGRPLFVVDPPTGRVFFGEHFWYDPTDGAIHTPNDKTIIRDDGTIEAVDGRFEGGVWANSGYFRGRFDTTALKLEPGTLNSYVNTASSAITQIKNLVIYALDTLGLSGNTLYRASVPSGTYQTNSGSTLSGDNVKYVAYRRQYIGYGDYSYTVYFYNISKTLILSVQYNDVSGGGKYYFTTSISITTYTGGDSLIVSSDIPTESTGLLNYQIYLSGDTLKVKLP